ncbi:Tco5, signal transduction HAMP domain histidine kinase [Melanogaster broomeanus]|nr:Tco5, signal transduction HAMP domain histidine kinase [Melanogaster broomeanus]
MAPPQPEMGDLPLPVALAGTTGSARRTKRKPARIDGIKAHWARFMKRVGTDPPSDSSAVADASSQVKQGMEDDVDGDEVDEISATIPEDRLFCRLIYWLRWDVWRAVVKFFCVRFFDDKTEERYHKEHWFIKKSLVLCSSMFLVANWVIGACTIAPPVTILDDIWIYGITPALTLPLVLLVIFDFPRDRPVPYQILVGCATWCWSVHSTSSVRRIFLACFSTSVLLFSYFPRVNNPNSYTSALQTIALFGLMASRSAALIGALSYFVLGSVLVLPYRPSWIRHLLNFLLYHIFLLFVHYMHENSERRLFILREQLKNQFKATQKAQVNERNEADSKRRLTSYVRVPLNTALLAVQNMEASGAVSKTQEIEFMALGGSLVMMSKVLNDMLDFNRMDSGRFEILSKPYAFHAVIRTLFIPLRMATDARNLELVTHLDEIIDEVAHRAACEAAGEDPDAMSDQGDGVVLGDALRLHQIINNLASNACKFTPAGGRVTCTTRLLFPAHPQPEPSRDSQLQAKLEDDAIEAVLVTARDDAESIPSHSDEEGQQTFDTSVPPQHKTPLKRIVVRIEVSDTGCGIPPREIAQGKLFTAFNQTEQGRQQGGKGTGLGLALVRQIVKLSGGRLGVRSKLGHGSTFWVELPLGVGVKVVDPPDPELGLSEKHSTGLAGPLSIDFPRGRRTPRPATTPKVMESLMDMGGLKLPNASNVSEPDVLTRSIGELSSGAQLGPPLPGSPVAGPSRLPDHNCLYSRTQNSSGASALTQRNRSPVVFKPPMIVLVVDDDRLTRTIMSRTLSRLGCQVFTAENGEMALEMIIGRTFRDTETSNAYLFLDNQMPIMSGLEVVTKLREMKRCDFVVGVTGNALIDDQNEYLEAGVDYMLTKPVFEPSLIKMLAIADELRRQQIPCRDDPSPSHA